MRLPTIFITGVMLLWPGLASAEQYNARLARKVFSAKSPRPHAAARDLARHLFNAKAGTRMVSADGKLSASNDGYATDVTSWTRAGKVIRGYEANAVFGAKRADYLSTRVEKHGSGGIASAVITPEGRSTWTKVGRATVSWLQKRDARGRFGKKQPVSITARGSVGKRIINLEKGTLRAYTKNPGRSRVVGEARGPSGTYQHVERKLSPATVRRLVDQLQSR